MDAIEFKSVHLEVIHISEMNDKVNSQIALIEKIWADYFTENPGLSQYTTIAIQGMQEQVYEIWKFVAVITGFADLKHENRSRSSDMRFILSMYNRFASWTMLSDYDGPDDSRTSDELKELLTGALNVVDLDIDTDSLTDDASLVAALGMIRDRREYIAAKLMMHILVAAMKMSVSKDMGAFLTVMFILIARVLAFMITACPNPQTRTLSALITHLPMPEDTVFNGKAITSEMLAFFMPGADTNTSTK